MTAQRALHHDAHVSSQAAATRTLSSADHTQIPVPRHTTYQHLLAVINTELTRFSPGSLVRVLDVGCGSGRLVTFLVESLPRLHPGLTFEVHGFDVFEHCTESFDETVDELTKKFPDVPWQHRFKLIPPTDPWPYPDGYFDVVLSNQVMEHLSDHSAFLAQNHRTLKDKGFSVHLFPLKHVLQEFHINVPLAHRIGNHTLLTSYIKALNRIGLGLFRKERDELGMTLDEYAESRAAYLVKYTGYISQRELLTASKSNGLLCSFTYAKEIYSQKVRRMIRRPPVLEYRRRRGARGDSLLVYALRYMSSVTVLLEKEHPNAT